MSSVTENNGGFVAVQTTGAGVTAPVIGQHHFYSYRYGVGGLNPPYGGPANSLTLEPGLRDYPDPFEGKEYRTEAPGLRRVEQVFGVVNAATGVAKACQENTTLLDSGQTGGKVFLYGPFENLTDLYEYDYGSAPSIQTYTDGSGNTYSVCPSSLGSYARRTHTDFLGDPAYTGESVHLRELPVRTEVVNAGGQTASVTEYFYDQQTDGEECSWQPGLVGRPGIAQHDGAFGTGYATRGNVKCVARWRNLPTEQWLVTRRLHDVAGNVVQTVDARGHATNFSYDSSCSYGPANTYAFVTRITNALNHEVSLRYDCNLGKADWMRDANNAVTTLAYNDALDRLTAVTYPLGTTTYAYDDAPLAHRVTTTRSQNSCGTNSIVAEALYDGLGRPVEERELLVGAGADIVRGPKKAGDLMHLTIGGPIFKFRFRYRGRSGSIRNELEPRIAGSESRLRRLQIG